MPLSKALLSKIHIAKQQLGMEDDVYRSLLARVAGVRSSTELTQRQVGAVLREFERLGFQPKPGSKTTGKPHNFQQMPARITKIEALLADMKLPWAYADALAKQMFKVARVAWVKKVDHLDALIAALHVEQEKRQLLSSVEGLCQQLGIEHPEQVDGLEELPDGWKRQRPILKALVETLESAVAARRHD